ncbi:probable pectinesterase/pectinesterase inhibitor 47 [Notolabrus celidotus]|uniref:probable pectinesterase/pectinesterase inhibitor 47 n=1 Tax=Notolabrus celidotus TaxID=1203425 RepID=UPI00148FAB42|nr:probable pectinesterase/pectinesterase inhibitor 47 [Notolabrus celidotus]
MKIWGKKIHSPLCAKTSLPHKPSTRPVVQPAIQLSSHPSTQPTRPPGRQPARPALPCPELATCRSHQVVTDVVKIRKEDEGELTLTPKRTQ